MVSDIIHRFWIINCYWFRWIYLALATLGFRGHVTSFFKNKVTTNCWMRFIMHKSLLQTFLSFSFILFLTKVDNWGICLYIAVMLVCRICPTVIFRFAARQWMINECKQYFIPFWNQYSFSTQIHQDVAVKLVCRLHPWPAAVTFLYWCLILPRAVTVIAVCIVSKIIHHIHGHKNECICAATFLCMYWKTEKFPGSNFLG